MALTRDEWYEKIKTWIPSWFFEVEDTNQAVIKAFAKLLSTAELEIKEDMLKQTFITTATGSFLDLHGAERSVVRQPGESDDSYRERVRSVEFTITYPNLKLLIDSLLETGESVLIENQNHGFADDDVFADTPEAIYLSKRKNYNRFTVVIPPQALVDDTLFKSIIVRAIDEAKAVGVLYDIVYGGLLIELLAEDGEPILKENGEILYLG